jgi:hypothetical protein
MFAYYSRRRLTLGTREAATSAVGARGVEPKPSVTPNDSNAPRNAPTPAMRALPLLVLGVLLASAPPVARADRDMCVSPAVFGP